VRAVPWPTEDYVETKEFRGSRGREARDAHYRKFPHIYGDEKNMPFFIQQADPADFYQKTIEGGKGGKPGPEMYFLRDLITKSFTGTYNDTSKAFKTYQYLTGRTLLPSLEDHEKAFATMQDLFTKGEHFWGKDDLADDEGQKWSWLVAVQQPDGLWLRIYRRLNNGHRPLAVAKRGAEAELFQKVNWGTVRRRIDVSVYDEIDLDKFAMADRIMLKAMADREAKWAARKPGGRGARVERVKPPHWRSLYKKGRKGERTGEYIEPKEKLKTCASKRRAAVGQRR